MATQTVTFGYTTGQTLTLKLGALATDTIVDTASATERSNQTGIYAAAFTDIAAGVYRAIAYSGSTPVMEGFVKLTSATAVFAVEAVTPTETGGANTVTITVDDDSDNLLANAVVELLSGSSLVDRQTTNGSGVATLTADNGTYTLRVSVPTGGYSSSTNNSFSVSGATTGSVELTALAPTPSSVGYVTGYLYTDVNGVRIGNTAVTLTIVGRPTSGNNTTGLAVDDNRPITSDGDGYAEWTNLVPGAKYRVSYAGVTVDTTIAADATGSVPLNTIVGDGV